MAAVLSPLPRQNFLDNNGRPLVGGKLFTYSAGTTTKLATYTDSTGLTQNANPVILDFRGEANVWIPPNVSYKYTLAPATDTDPPTNPFWTVDQIVSSQLITLYGGVDVGVANAYVINFVANFSTLTDGILIYFVASNTNTLPSTLNVNGLGPVPILNQDGSDLLVGQILADTMVTVMYRGGAWTLLTSGTLGDGSLGPVLSGTFVPTWTGFSADPAGSVSYTRVGRIVTVQFTVDPAGTSDTTAMTITNLPSEIRPSTSPDARIPCFLIDNGVITAGAFGFGAAPGSLVFYLGTSPPNASGFTAAGIKGLPDFANLIYLAG
jgi:hypothetical protein